MFFRCLFLSISFYGLLANASCDDWFMKLNLKNNKNCASLCRTSKVDMSSYMCTDRCDFLCKAKNHDSKDNENIYGLTDDEVKFCKDNKIDCLQAYKASWEAEKICLDIYSVSDTNDESDACRHYIWAILLSQAIGSKNAEAVLNAHENNPREPKQQQAMDLANNRLGLLDFQKLNVDLSSNNQIKNSFIKQLKSDKLIVLKPRYKATGGLP